MGPRVVFVAGMLGASLVACSESVTSCGPVAIARPGTGAGYNPLRIARLLEAA